MKYIKFLLLLIMLLCVLTACGKGERNLKTNIYSSDKNITELVSKIYNNSQLFLISQLKVTMDELNEQYPIECLRKIEDNYRVAYLGNDSVAVLFFNSNKNKIFGKVYSLYLTKTDFNELKVGESLKNVQEIDPNGEYLFLYTGSSNAPKVSTHYTKDGYLITVEYDDGNTILRITTSLI